jgi:hypothetical protein
MCEDAEMPEELSATSLVRAEPSDCGYISNSAAVPSRLTSLPYHLNMSHHPMLLCIFIFLLHYCDQLFFLVGHVSPMVPRRLEMGSGFSCYGSSSGLAGAYVVFL